MENSLCNTANQKAPFSLAELSWNVKTFLIGGSTCELSESTNQGPPSVNGGYTATGISQAIRLARPYLVQLQSTNHSSPFKAFEAKQV